MELRHLIDYYGKLYHGPGTTLHDITIGLLFDVHVFGEEINNLAFTH